MIHLCDDGAVTVCDNGERFCDDGYYQSLLSVHTGVDGGMVTVYDNGSHFMAVVVLHGLVHDVGPR